MIRRDRRYSPNAARILEATCQNFILEGKLKLMYSCFWRGIAVTTMLMATVISLNAIAPGWQRQTLESTQDEREARSLIDEHWRRILVVCKPGAAYARVVVDFTHVRYFKFTDYKGIQFSGNSFAERGAKAYRANSAPIASSIKVWTTGDAAWRDYSASNLKDSQELISFTYTVLKKNGVWTSSQRVRVDDTPSCNEVSDYLPSPLSPAEIRAYIGKNRLEDQAKYRLSDWGFKPCSEDGPRYSLATSMNGYAIFRSDRVDVQASNVAVDYVKGDGPRYIGNVSIQMSGIKILRSSPGISIPGRITMNFTAVLTEIVSLNAVNWKTRGFQWNISPDTAICSLRCALVSDPEAVDYHLRKDPKAMCAPLYQVDR
jgi:hypothetical protein